MTDPSSKPSIDRLVTLARLGAARAAEAHAQLAGESIRALPPVLRASPASQPPTPGRDSGAPGGGEGAGTTAVLFELEGCLDALIGIVFPHASRDSLVRRIVCLEDEVLAPEIVESALMEVGNILASHVASAIADHLGSRLLPSIPSIAMDDGNAALEALVEARVGCEALWLESLLVDAAGRPRGRLVLVPSGDGRPSETDRAAALDGL